MRCIVGCQLESLESRRLMTYTLTDLHLDSHGGAGLENGLANAPDINNAGMVTALGAAGTSIYEHGMLRVVRSGAIKLIDVGNAGAKLNSYAKGLNETNLIVGAYTDTKLVPHAYVSTLGKSDAVTFKKLGDIKGVSGTTALAVNKGGNVAGEAGSLTGKERAVAWERGKAGAYTTVSLPELGKSPLAGASSPAIAFDLNDKNVIVGSATDSSLRTRAVIWKKGSKGYAVTDLGALSGGFQSSTGYAINELAQVAGSSTGADFRPHAVVFSLNSKGKYGITDLGIPKGADSSEAIDINESGAIVGRATFNAETHTMIWTKNSKGKYSATDLQKQLPAGTTWMLEQPTSINDSGAIVGKGLFGDGVATWMLTLSGKGTTIKLATVTAGVSPDASPTIAQSSAKISRFSTHEIIESVLL